MYTADELEIRCALAGSPRAEQLIACLEGEIAKRDARIEAQEDQINILQSDANSWQSGYDEGRRMGAKHAAPVSEAKAQGAVMPEPDIKTGHGYPAYSVAAVTELFARLNAAPVQQVSVPDERANFESEYLKANYPRVYSGELSAPPIFGQTAKGEYEDDDMQKCWVMWQSRAMLNAAPAAPAADAGLVDMYRHLQTVTPYRFKKIQDASVTDGGDVLYFHKDRFDAALLADMAAHCAAKGVV